MQYAITLSENEALANSVDGYMARQFISAYSFTELGDKIVSWSTDTLSSAVSMSQPQ